MRHRIRLHTDSALNIIMAIDKQDLPWELRASAIVPQGTQRFELWQDGSPTPLTITLFQDGTWTASTEIEI